MRESLDSLAFPRRKKERKKGFFFSKKKKFFLRFYRKSQRFASISAA